MALVLAPGVTGQQMLIIYFSLQLLYCNMCQTQMILNRQWFDWFHLQQLIVDTQNVIFQIIPVYCDNIIKWQMTYKDSVSVILTALTCPSLSWMITSVWRL